MIEVYNEIYKFVLNELEKKVIQNLTPMIFFKFVQGNDFKIKLNNILLENKYNALSLMNLLYPLYKKTSRVIRNRLAKIYS